VEHSGVRLEPQSFAASDGQFEDGPRGESSRSGSSISDSVARGKEAIGGAATEAMNSAGSDLQSLRADLNGLKDTLATFVLVRAARRRRKSRRRRGRRVVGIVDIGNLLATGRLPNGPLARCYKRQH
jgi:hypothetical protein